MIVMVEPLIFLVNFLVDAVEKISDLLHCSDIGKCKKCSVC